jgi:hypothetical protein
VYKRQDYEYEGVATPFPKELLIPRSEWKPRIQEMEETKSRLSDQIRLAKLPHKDQARTNFCWGNAPVHCVEIDRLVANQETVILSPASVCAKIKNYRNVGGWGKEALDYIIKYGIAPVDLWPANAIDPKYDNVESKRHREKYKVVEWFECIPRNLDQMVSMLLRRKPGAAGLNWWSHEVTYCDPMWLDGDIAIRARNSWEGYGDFGFFTLQGSKMLADDLVFPSTVLAT